MTVRDTGLEDVDWIQMIQDLFQWRFYVNTIVNLRAGNLLIS